MSGLAMRVVYKEWVRQVYEELRLLIRGQFGFETVTAKLLISVCCTVMVMQITTPTKRRCIKASFGRP